MKRETKLTTERHQQGSLPPLWITRLPEGVWMTQADYLAPVPWREGIESALLVPMGFRFDLASVPRIFWRFIAPFELSLAAPLVHDYLYRYGGRYTDAHPSWAGVERQLTRKEADNVFYQLMIREGVPGWRAKAAYLAVRAGGFRSWGSGEVGKA